MKIRAWVVVGTIAVAVAIGWAAYTITFTAIVNERVESFSSRPEIENWAVPSYGVHEIAFRIGVAAAGLTLVALQAIFLIRSRARSRALGTTSEPADRVRGMVTAFVCLGLGTGAHGVQLGNRR